MSMNVVCICGSTRFREQIVAATRDRTLAGDIVLAPGVFGHSGDAMTEGQKVALDALHLRKIDMADRVLVVNPGGYIGESTAREIAYAHSTHTPVTYTVPTTPLLAQPTATPDLYDEPVTLPVLAEMVEEASDLIDGVNDVLAALRHDMTDHSARHELRAVGTDLGQAWAHARRALTALREVVAVMPPTT